MKPFISLLGALLLAAAPLSLAAQTEEPRPERRAPGAQPGRENGFPGRTPGFSRMGDASFGEE